jgi:ribosomal protein L32
MTTCAHCETKILPHRACTECGYYDGRAVMPPKGAKASDEV